jgi:hypothetical protein
MRPRCPPCRMGLLFLIPLLSLPVLAQTSPERTNVAAFYRSADFGDFALINGALNANDARQIRDYSIFESSAECYLLPPQENYWFALNNRSADFSLAYWASFITVVYEDSTNANFLSLFRNGGWVGRRGNLLGPFARNSFQIELDPMKFLRFHSGRTAQERARAWAQFEPIAGQFHGTLRSTPFDSWEYFPAIAGPIGHLWPTPRAISASLYRYPVERGERPLQPVHLRIPRYGSTRFHVIVETPGLQDEANSQWRTFATNANGCKAR